MKKFFVLGLALMMLFMVSCQSTQNEAPAEAVVEETAAAEAPAPAAIAEGGMTAEQFIAAVEAGQSVVLTNDIHLDRTVNVAAGATVTISDNGDAASILRAPEFGDVMFRVPADSTLMIIGSASDNIRLDGAEVPATASMIETAGVVVLTNVYACNANSTANGGVICTKSETATSAIYATGCNFYNNRGKQGASIYTAYKNKANYYKELVLENCTFTDNVASNRGAVVAMDEAENVVVKGCLFENCSATATTNNYGGAALSVCKGIKNVLISDCTFKDNAMYQGEMTNSGWGGAISLYALPAGNSTIAITGCTFTGNKADRGGAAIGVNDSSTREKDVLNTVTITGCTFTDNVEAAEFPGVVRVDNSVKNAGGVFTITMTDCTLGEGQTTFNV